MKKIFPKRPKLGLLKTPKIPKPVLPSIDIFSPVKELGEGLLNQVGKGVNGGIGLVTTTFGAIPFIGSTETSDAYDGNLWDERHYFLVPDDKTEQGFAIHVMRCLPKGVPPINELPKRRLVHLPNEHALPMLKEKLLVAARRDASEHNDGNFVSQNLDNVINEIDKIDDKMFGGVLLVGGLIALVNPLAGAAVALQAAVPSIGLILSKYGLKIASEKVTNMDVANRIKRAEKDVMAQFKQGQTIEIINPVLGNLDQDKSLDHWLTGPNDLRFTSNMHINLADVHRLLDLTEQAVINVCGPSRRDTVQKISRLILSDAQSN